jgi:hypothetical protein
MMKSISVSALVLSASLLVSPVAASATETASATQAAAPSAPAAAKSAAGEKKICKQLDLSGSRLPRRACLTAAEWKKVQDDVDR